jgi:hypothetical protein
MTENCITPLPVRFELHAYGTVYDVSDGISNWKEVELTLKRDETSGVFHQTSFPFEFVRDAHDALTGIFEAHKYRAAVEVYVYIRRDDWPYQAEKYHGPQVFSLDFATYVRTDAKTEIETKRDSLYDHLKAKGKVTYDIPATEIREAKPWRFDRIELENKIIFRAISDKFPDLIVSGSGDVSLGVAYEKTEVAVEDVLYTDTVAWKKRIDMSSPHGDTSGRFLFPAEGIDSVWIKYDIDIRGTIRYIRWGHPNLSLRLVTWDANEPGIRIVAEYPVPESDGADVTYAVDWRETGVFPIFKGQGCYLLFHYELDPEGIPYGFFADLDGTVTVRYAARYKPIDADVFSPKTLLRTLVDRMTGTRGAYGAEIEAFNEDANDLVMMSAAESIRGIAPGDESEGAKVHTSYNTFLRWMNVFGYEEHIAADALTFRRREKGFRADLTAAELGEDECADLKVYVNEDYLYSGVKIGYERKEIENANVRFEFNGVHDYASDLNLSDNVLELVSPYRADGYGIEFLAHERGKETTDDKADKDVFLVCVREGDAAYETVKSVFAGNVLTGIENGAVNDTMFNGRLNPLRLLKRNESLIGVSVERLKFTAGDSNAEITIDGEAINADRDIPPGAGLFEPVMYDVASRNMRALPEGEHMNGLVRFKYRGVVLEGFIDEITKNPAWESETVWRLLKKS